MIANPLRSPGRSRRVRTLLVDESPTMLKALSQILAREQGFTVVGSATDGCQALRNVSAVAPDLVLMGLHLSKLNGAQATIQIKQRKNPPVVFMVSAEDSPSCRATSEAAGADAFVATSADLELGLRSRLHEWFSPKASRCQHRSHSRSPRPRAKAQPLRSTATVKRHTIDLIF